MGTALVKGAAGNAQNAVNPPHHLNAAHLMVHPRSPPDAPSAPSDALRSLLPDVRFRRPAVAVDQPLGGPTRHHVREERGACRNGSISQAIVSHAGRHLKRHKERGARGPECPIEPADCRGLDLLGDGLTLL